MQNTFSELTLARKTALVAAAATVIGVFLPWVSVLGLSVSGISTGDGKLVLVVALLALVVLAADSGLVAWFNVSRKVAKIVSLVAASICLLIALADLNEFAAIGLYVILVASIAWGAAAVYSLRQESSDPAPTAPEEAPAGSQE